MHVLGEHHVGEPVQPVMQYGQNEGKDVSPPWQVWEKCKRSREVLRFRTPEEPSSLPGVYTEGAVTEPPATELRTKSKAHERPQNLNDGPINHTNLQG